MAYDPNNPVHVNAARMVVEGALLTDRITFLMGDLRHYLKRYGHLNVGAWVAASGGLGDSYIPDTALQAAHITAGITSLQAMITLLEATSEAHWKNLNEYSERGK